MEQRRGRAHLPGRYGARRTFLKWAPPGSGLDLESEAARMRWAHSYVPVPRVLDSGADAQGSWLLTAALPGEMAVTDRWKADPATAVTAIGSGLRSFHDALPVSSCPVSWSAAERVEWAERSAAAGGLVPARWHPDHSAMTLEQALRAVGDTPPVDRLVVCHGDTCAPNTLILADGTFCGHVDLGDLGVADQWADLAVATWSTTWNYGPGWEEPLLAAYGVEADPVRTRYYRLL
jgi:aminoglycoside phosphotransferase